MDVYYVLTNLCHGHIDLCPAINGGYCPLSVQDGAKSCFKVRPRHWKGVSWDILKEYAPTRIAEIFSEHKEEALKALQVTEVPKIVFPPTRL